MNGGIINSITRLHLVGYFYRVLLTEVKKISKVRWKWRESTHRVTVLRWWVTVSR